MKDMSFFTKIRLLIQYIKLIRKHRQTIVDKKNKLNLQIDKAHRMWVVLDHRGESDEVINYGVKYVESNIKNYLAKVDVLLSDLGFGELVGLIDMKDVSTSRTEVKHLIVIGFAPLRTTKLYRSLIIYSLSIIVLVILGLLIYF